MTYTFSKTQLISAFEKWNERMLLDDPEENQALLYVDAEEQADALIGFLGL